MELPARSRPRLSGEGFVRQCGASRVVLDRHIYEGRREGTSEHGRPGLDRLDASYEALPPRVVLRTLEPPPAAGARSIQRCVARLAAHGASVDNSPNPPSNEPHAKRSTHVINDSERAWLTAVFSASAHRLYIGFVRVSLETQYGCISRVNSESTSEPPYGRVVKRNLRVPGPQGIAARFSVSS